MNKIQNNDKCIYSFVSNLNTAYYINSDRQFITPCVQSDHFAKYVHTPLHTHNRSIT